MFQKRPCSLKLEQQTQRSKQTFSRHAINICPLIRQFVGGERKKEKKKKNHHRSLARGSIFWLCRGCVAWLSWKQEKSLTAAGVSCEAVQRVDGGSEIGIRTKSCCSIPQRRTRNFNPWAGRDTQGPSSPTPELCKQKWPKPNPSPQHSHNVNNYLWSQIRIGVLIP